MLKKLSSIVLTARYTLFAIFLIGCAGFSRSCSSEYAESFGADWIVITNGADGRVVNCWKLKDVSITNEPHSDGVYWKSGAGHLIHISGWYSRVQVNGGDYAGAANEIGVDLARCPSGRYLGETEAVIPAKPINTDEPAAVRRMLRRIETE